MYSVNQKVHYLKAGSPAPAESVTVHGLKTAKSMGLIRVAGNVFECPSSQDFWKVTGNKVIRLSAPEVDNDEHLKPANKANPSRYLKDILAELEL
jgi:hypothetical protein